MFYPQGRSTTRSMGEPRLMLSQWDSAADDDKNIRWTREFHEGERVG
jgi:hypothetical protein